MTGIAFPIRWFDFFVIPNPSIVIPAKAGIWLRRSDGSMRQPPERKRYPDNTDCAGGGRPVAELESALGVVFHDRSRLRQALTHTSFVNEHTADANPPASYERLEFLGDVVARLIVSEELYHRLPDCDEGGLTRRWTALLNQPSLAAAAVRLGLPDYIRLGRGADAAGSRRSPAVLCDVMESVIAAVYLDAGTDAARQFVLTTLSAEIDAACQPGWHPHNPKAELQELLQAQGNPPPTYRVISADGPAHQRQFTVAVVHDDRTLATGAGRNKSAAETAAAAAALDMLADGR